MRHVALIRGINVGTAKRVAMADLRALIEKLGCDDVETLLNSGNVVFTPRGSAKDMSSRIEKGMTTKLGVTARVLVLSATELSEIMEANTLEVADPSRFLVNVLMQPADRTKLAPLMKSKWSPEALALGKRVAYMWCADGIIKSKLAAAVSKAVENRITARNWATMLKLAAMVRR